MIIARMVFIADPLFRKGEGFWSSFLAIGHSGFSCNGRDVVCSAFSCLIRTVLRFGISLGWISYYQIRESFISFRIMEGKKEFHQEIHLVSGLLIIGLEDLEKEYPENLRFEIIRD